MAQRYMWKYKTLAESSIDEIDAAVFTGDTFILEANRNDFRAMMERWERQLKCWEQIEKNEDER